MNYRTKRTLVQLYLLSEYLYQIKPYRIRPTLTKLRILQLCLFSWIFFLYNFLSKTRFRPFPRQTYHSILISPYCRSADLSLYSLASIRSRFQSDSIQYADFFVDTNGFSSSIYDSNNVKSPANLTLQQLLHISRILTRLLFIPSLNQTPFYASSIKTIDYSSIRNLALVNALRQSLHGSKSIFHTYEGHGWERAIPLSLRSRSTNIFSVQQAPLTFRSAEHISRLRPLYSADRIITSGHTSRQIFINLNPRLKNSLLDTTYHQPQVSRLRYRASPSHILILPESIHNIEKSFELAVPLLLQAFPNATLTIRPHPNSTYVWSKPCERIQFSYNTKLEYDLSTCTLVVGSGSKAIVHAILAGCLPLIFLHDENNNIFWPLNSMEYGSFTLNSSASAIRGAVHSSLLNYRSISAFASHYFQDFSSFPPLS